MEVSPVHRIGSTPTFPDISTNQRYFSLVTSHITALYVFVYAGVVPSFKYINASEEQYYSAKNGTNEIRLKCIVEADTGHYRWSRDGKELFESGKYRVKKFRYLKIRNLVFADSGRYKCEAWNADGNIRAIFNVDVEGRGLLCSTIQFIDWFY